jgi:hypothetical protein
MLNTITTKSMFNLSVQLTSAQLQMKMIKESSQDYPLKMSMSFDLRMMIVTITHRSIIEHSCFIRSTHYRMHRRILVSAFTRFCPKNSFQCDREREREREKVNKQC